MINFYINYNYPASDVAHVCERLNPDGTYDWIFISQLGNHQKIRTAKNVKRSINKDSNYKPTSGVEFINAYIEVTNSFQKLSSSLFSEINEKIDF